METYRDRKQSVYRVYAKSYDDDRRLMLGDQALTTRMTFIADALSGFSAVLDLGASPARRLLAYRPCPCSRR